MDDFRDADLRHSPDEDECGWKLAYGTHECGARARRSGLCDEHERVISGLVDACGACAEEGRPCMVS